MAIGDRFKNLVSTVQTVAARVGEERELSIPENLINAAIDRLVVKGDIEYLAVRLGEGALQIDVELRTAWAHLAMTGDFELDDILIDERRQLISLRQLRTLDVRTSRHASSGYRLLFLTLSPVLGWLAGLAFRRALRGLEGASVTGNHYHFDLSPHIRKDSWLMTTISTLNVTGARFEPAVLVLRGNINVLGAFS